MKHGKTAHYKLLKNRNIRMSIIFCKEAYNLKHQKIIIRFNITVGKNCGVSMINVELFIHVWIFKKPNKTFLTEPDKFFNELKAWTRSFVPNAQIWQKSTVKNSILQAFKVCETLRKPKILSSSSTGNCVFGFHIFSLQYALIFISQKNSL